VISIVKVRKEPEAPPNPSIENPIALREVSAGMPYPYPFYLTQYKPEIKPMGYSYPFPFYIFDNIVPDAVVDNTLNTLSAVKRKNQEAI